MIEMHQDSTNAYADIGLPDADEMPVKAQLVSKIHSIIKTKGWTQQEAAAVLKVPQPKLSKVLRGQFQGVSEAKLLDCLTRLGRDVHIVIGPARESVSVGQVDVLSAA